MTPGESELSGVELERAVGALQGARLLIDGGQSEGATSRLYYAVFHAARAALLTKALHARTHKGQTETFIKTFGPAPLLSQLLGLQAKADYGREPFHATTNDLRAWAADAEAFVERCRQIVDAAVELGPDEPDPPPDV